MQPDSLERLLLLPNFSKLCNSHSRSSITWLPHTVNSLSESKYEKHRQTNGQLIPVDPVHGPIVLGPLAAVFYRTPAVQRLRHLHQLGASHYVFSGARHDRLAHSVGVAYLAWQLGNNLRLRGARICFWDLELLEVAGLLHDLGHGAFSHVFEHLFLKEIDILNWHHQHMSLKLLDHCVLQHNILLDYDSTCKIKDMISGAVVDSSKTHWSGWTAKDQWQLQIVANVTNGIDVDKLDYLMRDALSVGVCGVDRTVIHGIRRLLDHCKVVHGEICYSQEIQDDVANMYHFRAYMHHNIYQHPAVKGAEYMVVAALRLADPVLKISSKINSVEDYVTLDDRILCTITERAAAEPSNAQLQAAAAVVRRLEVQELFHCVAEADVLQQVLGNGYKPLKASEIVAKHNRSRSSVACSVQISESDVVVHNMKVDYWSRAENPLQFVQLYSSDQEDAPLQPASVGYNSMQGPFLVLKERVYITKAFSSPSDQAEHASAIAAAFTLVMQEKCGPDVVITDHSATHAADPADSHDNMELEASGAVTAAEDHPVIDLTATQDCGGCTQSQAGMDSQVATQGSWPYATQSMQQLSTQQQAAQQDSQQLHITQQQAAPQQPAQQESMQKESKQHHSTQQQSKQLEGRQQDSKQQQSEQLLKTQQQNMQLPSTQQQGKQPESRQLHSAQKQSKQRKRKPQQTTQQDSKKQKSKKQSTKKQLQSKQQHDKQQLSIQQSLSRKGLIQQQQGMQPKPALPAEMSGATQTSDLLWLTTQMSVQSQVELPAAMMPGSEGLAPVGAMSDGPTKKRKSG